MKKSKQGREPASPAYLAAGVTAQLAGVTALGSEGYYGAKALDKHKNTVKKMDDTQRRAKKKLENKIQKRVDKGGKGATKSELKAWRDLKKPFKFKSKDKLNIGKTTHPVYDFFRGNQSESNNKDTKVKRKTKKQTPHPNVRPIGTYKRKKINRFDHPSDYARIGTYKRKDKE